MNNTKCPDWFPRDHVEFQTAQTHHRPMGISWISGQSWRRNWRLPSCHASWRCPFEALIFHQARISLRTPVKTMVWICLNGGEGWKSLEWTIRRSNRIHTSFAFLFAFEPVIPRFMQLWTNRNLPGTWWKFMNIHWTFPQLAHKFIVDIFQYHVCLVQATKRCRRCNCWVMRFFFRIVMRKHVKQCANIDIL